MTSRVRRLMLVLGTTILIIQAVFMPIFMVNAETMTSQETQNESLLEKVSDAEDNNVKDSIIEESFISDDNETSPNTELQFEDMKDSVITESLITVDQEDTGIVKEQNNENLTFSIEGEKIIKADSNQPFAITVNINQEINKFRLILPGDASFSIPNSEKRKVQELSDGSIIWLVSTDKVSSNFNVELTYITSGQFSVEDEIGGIHADFVHVELDGYASRIAASRINLNVATWALFAAAWNNNIYTSITLIGNITATDVPILNTRNTNVEITTSSSAKQTMTSPVNHMLANSGQTTISSGVQLIGFGISGGTVLLTGFSYLELTAPSNLNRLSVDEGEYRYDLPSVRVRNSLRVTTLNIARGWIETDASTIQAETLILPNNGYYRIRNSQARQAISVPNVTIRNGLMTWNIDNLTNAADRGWRNLLATISNNKIVSSNISSFNDETFNIAQSRWLQGYGFTGGIVLPPEEYSLSLQASPNTGGTPTALAMTLLQGKSTKIEANTNEGYRFVRWEIISGNGSTLEDETSSETTFTMGNGNTVVEAIYEEENQNIDPVNPVDPLDPEVEVNPENTPELPEDQGQLSIDFISYFNFGSQAISVHDQTYYAQPQRLLNEDGTVNGFEERPNYVQISDRRSENERNGWELAVTQKEQFKDEENQVLNGASLSLSNTQVITAQGGTAPGLQSKLYTLVPGNRRTLLKAQGSEGTGTWIYRFGDGETAAESVALDVPRGANPESTAYSTTLVWELSTVPSN